MAWLVFAWIGLDNALFWGCVGGVLHLIPYAGPTAFVLLVGLVAYAQFEGLQPVVLVIGSMLTIVGVIGLLLVPWLTQRVGRLNAVTVFVSLLVWGWLWSNALLRSMMERSMCAAARQSRGARCSPFACP